METFSALLALCAGNPRVTAEWGRNYVAFAMGTVSNVYNNQEMQKVCHIRNSADSELAKWHGLNLTKYIYFEKQGQIPMAAENYDGKGW